MRYCANYYMENFFLYRIKMYLIFESWLSANVKRKTFAALTGFFQFFSPRPYVLNLVCELIINLVNYYSHMNYIKIWLILHIWCAIIKAKGHIPQTAVYFEINFLKIYIIPERSLYFDCCYIVECPMLVPLKYFKNCLLYVCKPNKMINWT